MKKRNPYFAIFTFLIFNWAFLISHAQTTKWLWANNALNITSDVSNSVAVDGSGNVWVTGSFESSTITFGSITLTNSNFSGPLNSDMFIVKYDANGNAIWGESVGGNGSVSGNSITVDESGNILITGTFACPTITLGLITLYNIGFDDMFIAKYDSLGNVLWAKNAIGSDIDFGQSITADVVGNIFVSGSFRSLSIVFDTITLTNQSVNVTSGFLAKYDGSGKVLWAKSIGGASNKISYSVAADGNGNVIVTGCFSGPTVTFGTTTLTNSGLMDVFIAKYDSSGNFLWAKSAGGINDDRGYGVVADSSGNVYLTGGFRSPSITFGNTTLTPDSISYADMYIVKYDAMGNVIWAKNEGGNSGELGYGIDIDASGNILVTGEFSSPNLTLGTTTLTPCGSSDLLIVKFDPSGNALWATSGGGIYSDPGKCIVNDIHNNIIVTGNSPSPTLIFGTDTLFNTGLGNFFIVKLKPCGGSTFINQIACNSFTSPSGNYIWTTSGTYIDTLTNSEGCDSIITINLTINPLPNAYYTLYPDTINPHNWFGINQCSGSQPISYIWNWGDSSAVSIGATPSHIYNSPGYYNICLSITDANGCSSTYCDSSTYLYKNSAKNSIATLTVFKSLPGIGYFDGTIYPNPVKDIFTVSMKDFSPSNPLVTITDMQGRIIIDAVISKNGSTLIIDVSKFSKGVYLLKMNDTVQKFVKQ